MLDELKEEAEYARGENETVVLRLEKNQKELNKIKGNIKSAKTELDSALKELASVKAEKEGTLPLSSNFTCVLG